MKIDIFGHPYHSTEYYFFDEDSIEYLYNNTDISYLNSYIDGQYAIHIIDDNKEIWFSDIFYFFPLFCNNKEIVLNFTDIKDKKSLTINKLFYDIVYFFEIEDNLYIKVNIDKSNNDINYKEITPSDKYFKNLIMNIMPFKGYKILDNNYVYIKNYNDFNFRSIKQYDIINDKQAIDILFNCLKNLFKNLNPYVDLSLGLDSRLIYSIFKYLNYNFKRVSENLEGMALDKLGIVSDNNYSKLDFFSDYIIYDIYDEIRTNYN